MPLAIVTRNPSVVKDTELKSLGFVLQHSIVNRLSCSDEGGSLTAEEIEVRFHDMGPHDMNSSDLAIEIIANKYPSRLANKDERKAQIQGDIIDHNRRLRLFSFELCDDRNFVWLWLVDASFGLFKRNMR